MRYAFAFKVAVAFMPFVGPFANADVDSNINSPVTETQNGAAAFQSSGSWVFVPIPVSNPTFGSGLELGALYLHAASDANPPATSGVGAMLTNNGSKVIGVFHDQSFENDRYRLTALLGTGRLEFRFYGVGADSPFSSYPVDYEFVGTNLRLTGLVRVRPDSFWFAGINLQESTAKVRFKTSEFNPALPDLQGNLRLGGLGPQLMYDSRDDKTFPTVGQLLTLRWSDFRSAWGSQIAYDKADADYVAYRSITPTLVGALRARYQRASESTPFFDLPGLELRGFSRDRYRDLQVVTAHGELRYALLPRWGLLGFVEAGRDAASFHDLGGARTIVSFGGGVRWQASADRRLYVGLDAAFTTDTNAMFISVGERF